MVIKCRIIILDDLSEEACFIFKQVLRKKFRFACTGVSAINPISRGGWEPKMPLGILLA